MMSQVEVEVQRNAYGPSEAERITRAFRGSHAAVHRAADTFVSEVMRHIPHDVAAGLEGAFGLPSGDDDTGKLPNQPSHLHGEAIVAHAPDVVHVMLNASSEPDVTIIREDEEDGWVSDQSSPESASVEKGHQQTTKSASNRAGKKRRIDRRHSSIHIHHHSSFPSPPPKGISTSESSSAPTEGPSTPIQDMPSSTVPETLTSSMDTTDEEPRGRPPPASAPSTIAIRRHPRHMRIMSLRGSETGSREVSPVRSIRWADADAGSSPATSRWPQSPSASAQGSRAPSPGPSTPGEPTEADLG
jgi:hypothetical protein